MSTLIWQQNSGSHLWGLESLEWKLCLKAIYPKLWPIWSYTCLFTWSHDHVGVKGEDKDKSFHFPSHFKFSSYIHVGWKPKGEIGK